ncbi:MAG TPA: hypothetical protein VJ723_00565 [Candidatus Angelobacter sp.]|nr:hypothetical protein [Candidatus Angelobacter sp.]
MNNRLFRFAHSHRILAPFSELYGCGWFDGGCFVFARALQLWLGGRLAVVVRRELFHEQTFDHAVLSLPDATDSREPLYIDADGVATACDLLECWRTRERLPDPALEDPADRVRFVGHLQKESWSCSLAQELKTRFGMPEGHELPRVLGRTTGQEHWYEESNVIACKAEQKCGTEDGEARSQTRSVCDLRQRQVSAASGPRQSAVAGHSVPGLLPDHEVHSQEVSFRAHSVSLVRRSNSGRCRAGSG